MGVIRTSRRRVILHEPRGSVLAYASYLSFILILVPAPKVNFRIKKWPPACIAHAKGQREKPNRDYFFARDFDRDFAGVVATGAGVVATGAGIVATGAGATIEPIDRLPCESIWNPVTATARTLRIDTTVVSGADLNCAMVTGPVLLTVAPLNATSHRRPRFPSARECFTIGSNRRANEVLADAASLRSSAMVAPFGRAQRRKQERLNPSE